MTTDNKNPLKSRIASLLTEAQERDDYIAKMLASREPAPGTGDLYELPVDDDVPLTWAILKRHPDAYDRLYVVPADVDPLAGTGDFRVPGISACGPLTLRCALGTWLPAAGLEVGIRIGFVEDLYVAAATELLQAISAGRALPGAEATAQIDMSPAYRTWIAAVSRCIEQVRAAVEEHAAKIDKPAAPQPAVATNASANLDDLVDYIRLFVRGGLTPRDAFKKLARGFPEGDARAALIRFERLTGRIRALAEPPALVDVPEAGQETEAWYVGPQAEDRFWPALEKYLRTTKGWSDEAVKDLDRASTKTLALLPPPGLGKFSARGLMLGYVQSGKTANYTALIAKAADANYKLFIVLSGLHNGLRAQTQRRLDQELVHLVADQWHTLTDARADFRGQGNVNALLGGGETQRVLCVVKKNTFVLQRLLRWLSNANDLTLRSCPTLIIDDEADQASVNASDGEERRTRINNLILDLLKKLPRVSYVGLTATPYANLFIDPKVPEDLYPRDFIVDLPRPQAYFGPERIFGRPKLTQEDADIDGLDMIREVPDDEVPQLKPRGHLDQGTFYPDITPSLEQAIRYFWLASAARRSAGHLLDASTATQKHSSMLIHTTMYADVHARMSEKVADYRNDILEKLRKKEKRLLGELKEIWTNELQAIPVEEGGIRAPFDTVKQHLVSVVEATEIVVENFRSMLRLEYGQDPTVKIVIGGNTLSRGLTLEGLTVSYFVRAASAYDTLMQMGRWFGYRPGYENLPRIWMTDELEDWFFHLALVEQEIRNDIKRYELEHMTPLQLQVRVRTHPQMSITSAAKMQHAVDCEVSYAGRHVQTILFKHRDQSWLTTNIEAGRMLLKGARASGIAVETVRDRFWRLRDVPASLIHRFLETYQCHESSQEVRTDLIKGYVEQQNARGALHYWSVAVVGRRRAAGAEELELAPDLKVPMLSRSRLKRLPGDANIGVLSSAQDVVVDLEKEPADLAALDKAALLKLRDDAEPDYKKRRGLLLLYPIWKDSPAEPVPNDKPQMRKDLEAVDDLLGMAMVFPQIPESADTPRKYKSVRRDALIEPEELPPEEEAAP